MGRDPIPGSGWSLWRKLEAAHLSDDQGVDTLNGPFITAPNFPPSNDPQFQGFGGETAPIQLHLRLRGYFPGIRPKTRHIIFGVLKSAKKLDPNYKPIFV
jgi:hypothetical protein